MKTGENLREYWAARGATVDAVKRLSSTSAAAIRAVWDYRAQGLGIEAARAAVEHTLDASHAAVRRREGQQYQARERRRLRYHVPTEGGRILALAAERRRLRAEAAREVAAALTPGDWLAWRPTWQDGIARLLLPDGRLLVTVRHESATWDRRGTHRWPDHTEIRYRTQLRDPAIPLDARGLPVSAPVVEHDARGDWRSRVIRTLGLLAAGDGSAMACRLHCACTIADHAGPDGYRLGERRLLGLHVDYYAATEDRATAYHAATLAEGLAGLRRKLRHAEAAARGELLTADIAADRWGFCRAGLKEFAAAIGVDARGGYLVEDLRERITPEVRRRFGAELATAGI